MNVAVEEEVYTIRAGQAEHERAADAGTGWILCERCYDRGRGADESVGVRSQAANATPSVMRRSTFVITHHPFVDTALNIQ